MAGGYRSDGISATDATGTAGGQDSRRFDDEPIPPPPPEIIMALKGPEQPNPAELPAELPPHPWGDNSYKCGVYGRPLNPRILLVVFPEGHHGRVVCHPKERARFCPGDVLWVRAVAGKDLYIIAGRYNRRGIRIA
jgi:hypothetical protein